MSREVKTLVFFDLESTSLIDSVKKPPIIELFMLAVGRGQFLTPEKPRVLNSLRLAFRSNKPIPLNSSHIHGLYNDALEDQETFDADTVELIDRFLSRLKKPVCLLAHNGCKFDFVLLQSELLQNEIQLMPDLLCADTLLAFQFIKQTRYLQARYPDSSSYSKCALFQLHTPAKRTSKTVSVASSPVKVSKKLPPLFRHKEIPTGRQTVRRKLWPKDSKIIVKTTISPIDNKEISIDTNVTTVMANDDEPNQNQNLNRDQTGHQSENVAGTNSTSKTKYSYKLVDIYKRELNNTKVDAHCAEDDVMMMFDIAFKWNKEFLDWVDKYAVKFSDTSFV